MKRHRSAVPKTLDIDLLPAAIRRQVAALRPHSRGVRSAGEWRVFKQRLADANANLAIEDMPLTEEELGFFRLVFSLNLPREDEDALHLAWAAAQAKRASKIAQAAE